MRDWFRINSGYMVAWLVIAVAGVAAVIFACQIRDFNYDGECVLIRPYVVISWKITSHNGPSVYYLEYGGKTEKSGEKCSEWHRVTETRYEQHRWMYGYEESIE